MRLREVRYYSNKVLAMESHNAAEDAESVVCCYGMDSIGQLSALDDEGNLVSYVPLRSSHNSPYTEGDCIPIASTCNITEETQMLALRCVSVVSTGEGIPCHRKGVDSPTSVSLLLSEKSGGHSWIPFCGQLRRSGG